MTLWKVWFDHVGRLRGAFSRDRTFLWFVMAMVACTVRPDLVGVTSFVRACWLKQCCYQAFRRLFHSSAVSLERLTRLWVSLAFEAAGSRCVRVEGKRVLLCDGLKAPKEGRKMPAVKSLHQESTNNSKPEFIMGHSWQVISFLVVAGTSLFAVPLSARIHEGVVFTNRDHRTVIDRMVELIGSLGIGEPVYLLADAYYACRKIARALLHSGSHLISRVRITAVAYEAVPVIPNGKRGRGRPRLYGRKIRLRTLFDDPAAMTEIESPYSGDRDVRLRTCCRDLVWKPVGQLVRFVAVVHPTLGRRILLSTDLTRPVAEIIQMYGWRFKIEVGFKQAIHVVGAWAYHFWMAIMKRTRRGGGDQYLHRATDDYRAQVRRKIQAYELHVQIGLIAQGLLQCLAATAAQQVWSAWRGWLRTIRPGLPPSELVVAQALRNALPEFLVRCSPNHFFAKFMAGKIDPDRAQGFLIAA